MEALVSAFAFLVLIGLLFAACVTDIRDRKIPNWLVLDIIALWLAWHLLSYAIGSGPLACRYAIGSGPLACSSIVLDVLGAVAFGAAMLVFATFAERVTGKFMLGGGDIKLLVAVSLFLGIDGILVALFTACIISFAYAAAKLKRGIPFAPCILGGTLLALLLT